MCDPCKSSDKDPPQLRTESTLLIRTCKTLRVCSQLSSSFPFFFFLSFFFFFNVDQGFPSESVVKNLPAKAGHMNSILRSRKFLGEGNGNPVLYSCLHNPMDREVYSPWGRKRIRHDLATKHYFKVFTKFVTISLLFYVLGFWL